MNDETWIESCGIGSGRIGDWLQTRTGVMFHPLDPREDEIWIEDIAWALSNICRFGGHTSDFYSVAQHSVLLSLFLPEEFRLWGLLHDATEAYLGDIVTPIKVVPSFEVYRTAEARLEEMIARRFGLTYPMPQEVKVADKVLLLTECRDLMGDAAWGKNAAKHFELEPLTFTIRPMAPQRARFEFIRQWSKLVPNGGVLGYPIGQRGSLEALLK